MLENTPSLQELDLKGLRLGDEGIIQICRGLRSEGCALKSLDISRNNIGDTGTLALAAVLSQNQTLVDLDLGHNNIGRDGAIAIANALTTNSSLQNMKLNNNPIGEDGASSIGQALQGNHTLKTLCLTKLYFFIHYQHSSHEWAQNPLFHRGVRL